MNNLKEILKRVGIAVLVCIVYSIVMGILLFIVTPIVLFFSLVIIVNGININFSPSDWIAKFKNILFKGNEHIKFG